jgi:site-specific DNA-adenine methylase
MIYFGNKEKAAPLIWALLGDVQNYIEPFCGSASVVLNRPPVVGHRSELINDFSALVVNAHRAIRENIAAGWVEYTSVANGSGYSHIAHDSREALYANPACLKKQEAKQMTLCLER